MGNTAGVGVLGPFSPYMTGGRYVSILFARNQTFNISSECSLLLGLFLVTSAVYDFHGQLFKVQPVGGECV